MTVSRAVIGQRLHQTATSWRQICQLLDTQIPFAEADDIDFSPYPPSALLAVSRRLDLPLATLVPELAALFHPQTTAPDPTDNNSARADMAPSDVAETGTDAGPGPAAWESSSLDQRGMTVLTAFAHAACPLGATELAQALTVPLAEVTVVVEHLLQHPQLAGPLRLRPVPPDLYELRPRVDLLDSDQLLMLKTMQISGDGMTVVEATVLRAAVDIDQDYLTKRYDISGFLRDNPEVADRLVRLGYLQPPALTDAYIVDPDVLNSLRSARVRRPDREPHFEHVRSPQRTEPGNSEYASRAENAFPLRHVSYEPLHSRHHHPSATASDDGAEPSADADQDSSHSASPAQDTPP